MVARRRNRIIRDGYKKASKDVRRLMLAGDTKKAAEALKIAYSKIDIAAKKKVLHKNNASRRKARLAALLKIKPETKKPVATKKTTTRKTSTK